MSDNTLIEKAKAFLSRRKRRYWSDTQIAAEQMADFTAEMIEHQALQFNDAIPAMKEAYQQGKRDGEQIAAEVLAAERKRIADDLEDEIETYDGPNNCSAAGMSIGWNDAIRRAKDIVMEAENG